MLRAVTDLHIKNLVTQLFSCPIYLQTKVHVGPSEEDEYKIKL